MRYIFFFIAGLYALFASALVAQDWEEKSLFTAEEPTRILRVLSSTDTSFFAPIIESFLAQNPQTSVEYLVTSTSNLDDFFRKNPSQFDVVISSAMDLQLKLANDGYAAKTTGIALPDWADWRSSLFAFTSEPAAIVINRAAFKGKRLPQTRQDLILALRARPDIFHGKIGTYDVRSSGLGYLFATQDARNSETFWRLMEVMGSLDTKLYCCSGEMIDDLASGKLAVAYNVLGSYAAARSDTGDALQIILPSDFPTTMMRTAFVSRDSQHIEHAKNFLRHLISLQSAPIDKEVFMLPPLSTEQGTARQSTIGLGPELLTYLDQLKRQTFLSEWVSAIIQK
ncbi:MAG: ABC transporter substrate-binding protein [Pacificibacter sp.]|uniref:ABC transporter substrate-binding protein n=1 Tax=Pacificibacter sp. TaxID=1917866 RepID=UPI003218DF99